MPENLQRLAAWLESMRITDAFGRFDLGARQAWDAASAVAVQRGDRYVGTEHLLIGLLEEPEVRPLLSGVWLAAGTAGEDAPVDSAALLVGLALEGGGIASLILRECGLPVDELQARVRDAPNSSPPHPQP